MPVCAVGRDVRGGDAAEFGVEHAPAGIGRRALVACGVAPAASGGLGEILAARRVGRPGRTLPTSRAESSAASASRPSDQRRIACRWRSQVLGCAERRVAAAATLACRIASKRGGDRGLVATLQRRIERLGLRVRPCLRRRDELVPLRPDLRLRVAFCPGYSAMLVCCGNRLGIAAVGLARVRRRRPAPLRDRPCPRQRP